MAYARKLLSISDSPPPSRPSPSETVAAETDFVLVLAALLCALICVVGLIAVARCAWLRRGLRAPGDRLANKGLKKKVLNLLPKYTYKVEAAAAVEEGCAICLGDYGDGDEIRVLPQCGHRFHVQCIDTWLGAHSSCPSCRQILVLSRCRRCGEFPAVGSAGAGGGVSSAASTSSPTFLS